MQNLDVETDWYLYQKREIKSQAAGNFKFVFAITESGSFIYFLGNELNGDNFVKTNCLNGYKGASYNQVNKEIVSQVSNRLQITSKTLEDHCRKREYREILVGIANDMLLK